MERGIDENYWRERAEQLEHALASRVAIEQAKGVLSERLGIGVDAAFAVLRYAARGSRRRIHDLAAEVVAEDQTPPEVVRALARHRVVLAPSRRAQRIEQMEIFFRAVNEEIASNDEGEATEFVCECGNPACTESINLSKSALRALHAEPDLFVVIAGHELPDIESIVDRSDGYLIVRKRMLPSTAQD